MIELPDRNQVRYQSAFTFLSKRLTNKDALDWAIKLKPDQLAERSAVRDLLYDPKLNLVNYWKAAWSLLEESWHVETQNRRDRVLAQFKIQRALASGSSSGATLDEIVKAVTPRMRVESRREQHERLKRYSSQKIRLPKRQEASDLISIRFDEAEVLDPQKIGLDKVVDFEFLSELASRVEGVIWNVIGVARRLREEKSLQYLIVGEVNRVYYVAKDKREDEHEPDQFHHGVAAAVKLLFAIVDRIAALSEIVGKSYVDRWRASSESIFLRLWAAFATTSQVIKGDEIAAYLESRDEDEFWNAFRYPENAELRALRLSKLSKAKQEIVLNRIIVGPQKTYLKRRVPAKDISNVIEMNIGRELKRLEISGYVLSGIYRDKLSKLESKHASLKKIQRIDFDFPGMIKVRWVAPNPNKKFDTVSGEERLHALEADLSKARTNFDSDPAARASDWLRVPKNAEIVLQELLQANSPSDFSRVWNDIGWVFSSPGEAGAKLRSPQEAKFAASAIVGLKDEAIKEAIPGIAAWVSHSVEFLSQPLFTLLWERLWPIAENFTNENYERELKRNNAIDPDTVDSDILNSPAGYLIGFFFAAFINKFSGENASSSFDDEPELKNARDFRQFPLLAVQKRLSSIAFCKGQIGFCTLMQHGLVTIYLVTLKVSQETPCCTGTQ